MRAAPTAARTTAPPMTLIVPSIHGCTVQTKFSVVPFLAVTLNVTLPLGGR